MNALGVDVSRWQTGIDWQVFKAAGIDFALIKASQGARLQDARRREHNQGARAAGMLTGFFHWVDPTHDGQAQIDNFLKAAAGYAYDFAAVDVEQHWLSWSEWSKGAVKRFAAPERISSVALQTAQGLRKGTGKPVLIYTRTTFVENYARPMSAWLPEWPLWLAHYPYARGKQSVDWETFKSRWLPKIPGPNLPQGCREWKIWQFSGDQFILPGCQSPIDLNLFNGGLADLRAWCRPADALAVDKLERLWAAHPQLHGTG